MEIRQALIDLMKQVLAGGKITKEDVFAAAPDPTMPDQIERLARQRLSHWADDDDIRVKDYGHADMQK